MVDERLYFIRGAYIRDAIEELAKNGNAYFSSEEIFAACKPRVAFRQFQADLLYLMQTGGARRAAAVSQTYVALRKLRFTETC